MLTFIQLIKSAESCGGKSIRADAGAHDLAGNGGVGVCVAAAADNLGNNVFETGFCDLLGCEDGKGDRLHDVS